MSIPRRDALKIALATLALSACRRRDAPAPAARAPVAPAGTSAGRPSGGILPGDRWNPARTWVFAVGILEWQDSTTYASFPSADRKDTVLLDRLRARGVPAEQVTFVSDRDATREALTRQLAATVARVPPGDLFWFYYAGHGVIDDSGAMYMVPHDTRDDLPRTAWPLTTVLAALDAGLRGPVLLTADCCHSGAMVAAAAAPHPVPYAALASSLSSEESTGNWTFTECLIAGLEGVVPGAGAAPGVLTLQALADFTARRMASEEEQLATFGTGGGFPPALALGPTVARGDPRVGTQVEAHADDQWYRARVEAVREDGLVRVHYAGYPGAQDEWVTPDRVRPYAPRVYAAGAAVEAEWHGRWYPAVVLGERLSIHHVHYDGFDDDWNEWVSSRRIRPRPA